MFVKGDRVRLVEDFNNEPGILLTGSVGTVTVESNGMVFVQFDYLNDPEFQEHVRHNNRHGGLPMLTEEIERV
jgi:hypothetical protein